MENTTLAGRNTPVRVGENVEVGSRTLNVGVVALIISMFEDGKLIFGKENRGGRANFGTFEQERGFFSGLADVMDNPWGVFVSGFHLKKGWDYVKNVWDGPNDQYGNPAPVAYVNFALLKDADVIKRLAFWGIKPGGKSGNNWLSLSASRGKLFPLHTIRFETQKALVERANKVIEGGVAEFKELPFGWRDNYDRLIATYHKHYGIEAVLRLMEGTLTVVMSNEYVMDWQAPRLVKQFDMLFATPEERASHYRTSVDNKQARSKLHGAANKIANDEPVTEYVGSAAELGVAEVWEDGAVCMASFEDLYGKSVRWVYPDGSSAMPGKAFIAEDKPEKILGALKIAEDTGSYITVVTE